MFSPKERDNNQRLTKIIKKFKHMPVILWVIDKIEVICGLYICKWGEIGSSDFFIYFTGINTE